jgi:hydrogenase small subunit
VPDIHVLWLTAGLGCDGDTVAITAATQPRLDADRQIPLGANEPNTDGILGAGSCAAE